MHEFRKFTTALEDHHQRLDILITKLCPDLSRTRIQHLIRQGCIKVNGACATSSQKSIQGAELEIIIPASIDAVPEAQDILLDIIFEDDDLLVINKAVGMVVHPAPGSLDQTLVNALLAHCELSLSGIGGVKRPGIVHRLDKGTSGLLVVAKNDATHRGLSEQFALRTLNRTYQTLIWGVLNPLSATITGAIGRSPHHRQKMALVSRGGKMAITHYKTLETFGIIASLVECKLETGRTHQIRVHLATQGHPVIGDPLYGKTPRAISLDLRKEIDHITQNQRPLLHAGYLEFIHPQTHQTLKLKQSLPDDFIQALKLFENLKKKSLTEK